VGARIKFGDRGGARWLDLPGDPSWADRQGVASQGGLDSDKLKAKLKDLQTAGLQASFEAAKDGPGLALSCPPKGACAWKERNIIKGGGGEVALPPGRLAGKTPSVKPEWLCATPPAVELPGWKEKTPGKLCLFGNDLKGLKFQGGRYVGIKGTMTLGELVDTDPFCKPMEPDRPLPASCKAAPGPATLPVTVKVAMPLTVSKQ
jgi:hypothetical protein